jgi:hypothetical protein
MEQGLGMGLERLFQVDLRLCGIREWVSVHGMGWGGGEEGRIKLNPLIFFLLVYISRRDIMLVFIGLFDCIIFL